jgi:lysophospholipase L1-like esterase
MSWRIPLAAIRSGSVTISWCMTVLASVGTVFFIANRCVFDRRFRVFFGAVCALLGCAFCTATGAQAQMLTAANVKIEWKVENRFRLFRDAADFTTHETAWRQYKIHVDGQPLPPEERAALVATTSVLGSEHVLNDRFIPFTAHLRSKYDWRGWAARQQDATCWDREARAHSACGGVESYVMPSSHRVTARLAAKPAIALLTEMNCEWRVGSAAAVTVPCDEPVALDIPYPAGAAVAVNVEGELPVSTDIRVRDLLIAGLGDSFASGEGNPNLPVVLTNETRTRNIYPKRAIAGAGGNAQWTDELCHRSLYSHQLRAALQIAIENPQAAVTFLGYACSGAAIEEGVLGPQRYVTYQALDRDNGESDARAISGGKRDTQLHWLLSDICRAKPEKRDGAWVCPGRAYRRSVDYLFLSIGGNDIGFSDLVTWVSLRDGASSRLAKFFGATISAETFAKNMQNVLPDAYARLARAFENAVPLSSGDLAYDPSRVVLSSYPDILIDERDDVCAAGSEDDAEDAFPANQSLDIFSSWLRVDAGRIAAAHAQLARLHKRMFDLAGDHGWTFSGRAYEDRPFRGHGFCAQNKKRLADPSEDLIMPCWGTAPRDTATCSLNLSGKIQNWRPYDPQNENFPYALRQRWVRTFNDAYLVINEKVLDRQGRVHEAASQRIFSETTGAMHPSAEGQAAMADAILLDIRAMIAADLER